MAALPQAKAPAVELIPASVDVPFPKEYSAQKNLLLLGAALLIALLVVGFAMWHYTAPLKRIKGSPKALTTSSFEVLRLSLPSP